MGKVLWYLFSLWWFEWTKQNEDLTKVGKSSHFIFTKHYKNKTENVIVRRINRIQLGSLFAWHQNSLNYRQYLQWVTRVCWTKLPELIFLQSMLFYGKFGFTSVYWLRSSRDFLGVLRNIFFGHAQFLVVFLKHFFAWSYVVCGLCSRSLIREFITTAICTTWTHIKWGPSTLQTSLSIVANGFLCFSFFLATVHVLVKHLRVTDLCNLK